MNKISIHAAHYSLIWLERSETWIYEQISTLPKDVLSQVIADRTKNEQYFPFNKIDALDKRSQTEFILRKVASRLSLHRYSHINKALKRTRPEILHSHFGPTGWIASKPAKQAKIPHVVTFYGMDASRLPKIAPAWKNRYMDMFSSIQAVLCEGPHMAKQIELLGCDPNKITVHRLGVPISEINFSPRVKQPDSLRTLFVGRFTEKKGFPYGIQALNQIAKEIKVTATIVGYGDGTPAGDRETEKINVAASKAIFPIKFIEGADHATLKKLYYDHDVLVAPSLHADDGDAEGGAPVTIIEAAATGMPIISTQHCDIPDVLRKSKMLLAEEKNISSLVNSVRNLLDADWVSITTDIRRDLEKRHDSKKQGIALRNIYTRVLHL